MKKLAVIGGGIIGMTLANYLDLKKYHVTVFDEGVGQATKASAGIISPWLSKRRNKKWYALARDGAAFYEKMVVDFQLSEAVYKKSGTLIVRKAQALEELATLAETRRETAPAMGAIELLSSEETQARLPLLKPQPALAISGGGRLDGRAFLTQMQRLALQRGITIRQRKAETIKSTQHTVFLKIDSKIEEFDAVVFCNGPQSKESLAALGYQLQVRPQKGQLLAFQTKFASQNWPVAMLDGESDLIPFENDRILIGATHENEQGFDLTPTTAAFDLLKEKTLPFLQTADLFSEPCTYQVGTRAYTADFAPFFNFLKATPNIAVASGLGSSGLTTGPLIGYLLAQYFNFGVHDWEQYQQPLTNYLQ